MSSFINSAKHFKSVEQNLISLIYKDDFYIPYSLRDICPKWSNKRHYRIEHIEEEIRGIIDTLKVLQATCVNLQYKHHSKGNLDEEIQSHIQHLRTHKTQWEILTIAGLYKALLCVEYQIETEHLEELRELTQEETNALKFLEEIINSLAHYLVTRTEEYENATYAIEQ